MFATRAERQKAAATPGQTESSGPPMRTFGRPGTIDLSTVDLTSVVQRLMASRPEVPMEETSSTPGAPSGGVGAVAFGGTLGHPRPAVESAASRLVDHVTQNVVPQEDGTVRIPQADLEILLQQARSAKSGKPESPWPPIAARSGNKYYFIRDEGSKTGKSCIACGFAVASQMFGHGHTWDTIHGTGLVSGHREMEAAVGAHKRSYPRRAVLDLRI